MRKSYPPENFLTEIRLEREALKFSSAHMTIFADGTKEALHGHNYQVSVRINIRAASFKRKPEVALKEMIPFSILKKEVRALCESFDEKVLLPETSPFLKKHTSKRKENVEFTACGAFYSLPENEVVWLPVPTISCETLSESLVSQLLKRVPEKLWSQYKATTLSVEVLESPHQGATTQVELS